MRAPAFWYRKKSLRASLLSPFGALYAACVARRFRKTAPYQAGIPVICVGNLSVGGAGKTPVCLALHALLQSRGQSFFFLSHGYKGREKGILVNPQVHTASDVGDEALLLASQAPTVVDSRRARGAQIAIKNGAAGLIMDDGFQNPDLVKTVSFVVVDGARGFGNGRVIPAGPLREPIAKGLARADAVIVAGEDSWGVRDYLQDRGISLPVLGGRFMLDAQALQELVGKPVMAFAGIAAPEKFFNALVARGINVVKKQTFPDHYFYTRFDIEKLLADAGDLTLVTTAKDYVKIPKYFLKNIRNVPGAFVFDSPSEALKIVEETL